MSKSSKGDADARRVLRNWKQIKLENCLNIWCSKNIKECTVIVHADIWSTYTYGVLMYATWEIGEMTIATKLTLIIKADRSVWFRFTHKKKKNEESGEKQEQHIKTPKLDEKLNT